MPFIVMMNPIDPYPLLGRGSITPIGKCAPINQYVQVWTYLFTYALRYYRWWKRILNHSCPKQLIFINFHH